MGGLGDKGGCFRDASATRLLWPERGVGRVGLGGKRGLGERVVL